MKTKKYVLKKAPHTNVSQIDFDAFYEDTDASWERKARRTQLRHWRNAMRHRRRQPL